MASISVVIPFHNAEATIGRTLQSMLRQQALPIMEIVLVNDGSTDGSQRVVDELLGREPALRKAVKMVTKAECGGLSAATLEGLRMATGTYMARCDADDEMPAEALSAMYEATEGEGYDVVCGPIMKVYGDGHHELMPLRTRFTSLDDMPLDTVTFSLCNKLIRRSLLINNDILPYVHFSCWEDVATTARVMALRPRVKTVEMPVYIYTDNGPGSSMSNGQRLVRLRDHMLCAEAVEGWLSARGLDVEYAQFVSYMRFISKVKYLRGASKDVKAWKETFADSNTRIMSYRHISLPMRLLLKAVDVLPTALTQKMADIAGHLIISKKELSVLENQ